MMQKNQGKPPGSGDYITGEYLQWDRLEKCLSHYCSIMLHNEAELNSNEHLFLSFMSIGWLKVTALLLGGLHLLQVYSTWLFCCWDSLECVLMAGVLGNKTNHINTEKASAHILYCICQSPIFTGWELCCASTKQLQNTQQRTFLERHEELKVDNMIKLMFASMCS